MPFYDYKCSKCGKIFEILKDMNDSSIQACSFCKSKSTKRIFNTFKRRIGESDLLNRYGTEGGSCDTCTSGACSSCSTKK